MAKKEKDLTKERLAHLAPVAKEIVKLIAEANLPIGETHARDNAKFDAVAKEAISLMMKNNVKFVDKDFLFQLVIQNFDQVGQIVRASLTRSLDQTMDVALDKSFRELTIEDMDRIIKFG